MLGRNEDKGRKTMSSRCRRHALAALLATGLSQVLLAAGACAADFDWMRFKGSTVSFLVNNNSIGTAIVANKAEFERLTGITLKVDIYQEQQMRQRLVTVLNARSDETDVFMTLVSREGQQFAKAGWYADLAALKDDAAPDYDFAGFSPALVKAVTINGTLTSMPLNIEGPVVFYRKDVFQKCGVAFPDSLNGLETAAKALKACEPSITPFVSRGLKDAVAYTFSNVAHNMGGKYIKDGKSDLCSPPNRAAIDLYAGLMKDYGPPGVVNYTFNQISALYRTGRAAMAFESQNELNSMMEGGAREADTGIRVLPPGPGGSVPTAIGWSMAISPFSQKKGPAWYLVQWASSPAMQARLVLSGVAAPRAGIEDRPEVRQWLAAKPVRADWQAAVAEIAAKGSSEVGYPIIANPASRGFIGQAVDDVLLGSKPTAAACADADRGLDALIAGN